MKVCCFGRGFVASRLTSDTVMEHFPRARLYVCVRVQVCAIDFDLTSH